MHHPKGVASTSWTVGLQVLVMHLHAGPEDAAEAISDEPDLITSPAAGPLRSSHARAETGSRNDGLESVGGKSADRAGGDVESAERLTRLGDNQPRRMAVDHPP